MGADHDFDQAYYEANGQLGDRPALRWYARLARRYMGSGGVLDIGCGTGHLLKHLSAAGAADGLEVSEFSAAEARKNSPRSVVFTDPVRLPTGTYQRFTAIHVVEHLDDATLRSLLTEVRRSAAPGARYLVVTPDADGRAHSLHGSRWNALTDPTHINLKSHDEWRSLFRAEGFTIEREGSDGLWNVPYSSSPKVVDGIRYAVPMALQFLSGRLFLAPGSGESALFVLS